MRTHFFVKAVELWVDVTGNLKLIAHNRRMGEKEEESESDSHPNHLINERAATLDDVITATFVISLIIITVLKRRQ